MNYLALYQKLSIFAPCLLVSLTTGERKKMAGKVFIPYLN